MAKPRNQSTLIYPVQFKEMVQIKALTQDEKPTTLHHEFDNTVQLFSPFMLQMPSDFISPDKKLENKWQEKATLFHAKIKDSMQKLHDDIPVRKDYFINPLQAMYDWLNPENPAGRHGRDIIAQAAAKMQIPLATKSQDRIGPA